MKISAKMTRIAAVAASVVATGAALNAVAAYDLSIATPVTSTYASELKVASTSASMSLGNLTVPLGAGMTGNTQYYLRVEFSNGKFASSAASGPTTTGTNPTTPTGSKGFASVAALVGGGSGDNYVVYSLASGASGNIAADPIVVYVPSVYTSDMVNPIVVTTKLYSAGEAAAAGTAASLKSYSGTWAKFATGINVAATALPAASATATVISGYKKWVSGATYGGIGTLLINPVSGVLNAAGTQVGLSDLLGSTAGSLVLTGDFTAGSATGVTLSPGNDCTGTLAQTAAFTASSATIGVQTIATITLPTSLASAPYGATSSSSPAFICFTPTGTTAIPKVTAITAKLTLVPATAASTTAVTDFTTVGAISRDGTTLQAPFFQAPSGWIPRIVLTNTGTSAASYTGVVTAGPSNVTGGTANAVATNASLTGTIPAGGQVIIENTSTSTVLPTFTQSQRGFVVFDIGGQNAYVNGIYQLVNATTGTITNTNMVRPNNTIGKD